MPFEFEALVGHLYIVGGRSISTVPPGALVEVAPKKAARGRETDTFFTLVMPSGDAVAPTSFYEQMARLAAERYFSSTGSVTSGLRDVFNTLNQNLFEHNQSGKRPYEANLLCAVLRGSDLIIGRIGPAVVILRNEGQTVTFPEDLGDDEALYTTPLGINPVPNVRMTQYRVSGGARLIMGDANLADLDVERLGGALMSVDLASVLLGVKELARLQLMMMAVEFVPPDVPAAQPLAEGESTAEILAAAREKKRQTAEVSAAAGRKPAASAAAQLKARRRQANEQLQQKTRYGLGRLLLGLAGILALMNRVIDRLFPSPVEGQRRWISAPAAAGTVVVIPVVVVGLVIVMWLAGTGQSEFEICLSEALSRANLARSIPSSERQTIISAWEQTLLQVDTCLRLRPNDPTLNALRLDGLSVIDSLNQVQRRNVTVLNTFFGATLSRIIAQGQDLYVLDSANSWVYRVQLTPDGRQTTGAGQAIPGMRRGATVDGYQVGDIFDIVYSVDNNVVMALDRTGVLVSCSPRFLQCEATRLLGVENWVNPVALAIYSGRLYVLDTAVGSGQIWRYDPSGGSYGSPPGEYFGGLGRPVLTNAVDFAIDERGAVYILLAEGVVLKYLSGEPQDFGFNGFPIGQELRSANAMYLDSSPIGQTLYVVNRVNRTIYETSLIGTFWNSYRTFNEEYFAAAGDIVAVPGPNMIYLVSGNAILAFPREG